MGDKKSKLKKSKKSDTKRFPSWLWIVIGGVLAISLVTVVLITRSATEHEHADSSAQQQKDEHQQHQDAEKDAKQDDDHQDHAEHKAPKPALVKQNWSLVKSPPVTTEPVQLRFKFMNYDTQEVLTDYEEYYEKKMHLIVISEDLQEFQHIHPEMSADGTFLATMNLQRPTKYKVFTDGKSKSVGWINEWAGIAMRTPEVVAKHTDKTKPLPEPKVDKPNLVVNDQQAQTIDGVEVLLEAKNLKVGKQSSLTFRFKDAADGKDITDLQPYLGSIGHVVLISETVDKYIHSHPTNEKERGPKATFSAVFEKPGKYKMWGEFKRNDQRFVVPYVIEVKP
jgi:hypothetical protein